MKIEITVITGKQAKLVNEANELIKANKEIQVKRQAKINVIMAEFAEEEKKNNTRLTTIEESLNDLKPGTFVTKKGSQVIVETKENRTWPSPEAVKEWLKSHRLGNSFNDVIKVQMGALKKVMSDTDIDSITALINKTKKITFKG